MQTLKSHLLFHFIEMLLGRCEKEQKTLGKLVNLITPKFAFAINSVHKSYRNFSNGETLLSCPNYHLHLEDIP